MNRRRITPTLGAAAGGLLGAAFLPVAVAFADDYNIVPDPGSTETVIGLYGLTVISPAQAASFQGYQLFDVVDTSTGQVVGTFDADEATAPYYQMFGGSNSEFLVTSVVSGTVGTGNGDVPPVGSVFDTLTFGQSGSGFENIYSDLASTTPGGDVISDTLVTPFGNFDLSGLGFDAAAGLATDSPRAALPPDIVPHPASTEVFTGISGLSPLDVAVQGYQEFDVVNSADTVVGTFDADEVTTSDIVGFYTHALLVTSDVSGTPGTAAGDVPPVGSVFNTIVLGDGGFENIYSDLASTTPGGNVISDTLVTPLGNLDLSWLFGGVDAAAGLAAHSPSQPFFFGDGYTIGPDPDSAETFTGINGLPPLNVSIQGSQLFDVLDANGNVVGTFNADETTIPDMWASNYSLTLLVTSDVSGTAGTGPGDVPPVGSVFDIASYGGGVENIYSDLVSTTPGGDVISDTLVTPLGNLDLSWLVQDIDAAASLAGVSFADATWAGIFSMF